MARLVVIGIDGMDPIVFEKIQDEMPNFASIMKSGSFKHLESVFPPDSIPAWVTIFTGEYPQDHGWLDNIDYEDLRKGEAVDKLCDLQNRTFWDRVGQAGKRVCIVNPLLAYPVWPVNGIMVSGPVFISGEKQIFPPELGGKYELPEMGGMTEFPAENELEQFLEMTLQSTKELANFGLDLLGNEDWDLYFISFFTLDRLQHFLWRFWDTSDPFYPGPSKLEGAIRKAYKMYDEIVGSFLAGLDEKTAVMVLSDHGHGQRPTKLFNLNEYLRQAGLLKTPERKNQRLSLKKSIEFVKNMSVRLVVKVLGESWLYRIGRLLPKHMRKALKKSSYLIDKENSLAWASELGGGASVGGVIINPRIASGSEQYRAISDKISELLEQINDSSYGQVVQWAKVQHEVNHYPDVIFELDPRFSVGRSFFCPIVEKNPRHKITSGGHKKEGILFTHNCQELHTKVSTMEDISNGIISFVLDQ